MSLYSITPADFAFDPKIKDKHRQVMLAFGVHSTRKSWIKLSQSKLASELGIARETVNRAVRDLTEWGYLEKRTPEETGKAICFYRIVMTRDEPSDDGDELSIEGDDDTQDVVPASDQTITGVCDGTDHRGVTVPVTGGVTVAVTHKGSIRRSNKNVPAAPARPSQALDLVLEVKKAVAQPELRITAADASKWSEWLATMTPADVERAEAAGEIFTTANWPREGARLIRIPRPSHSLTDRSQAMTGDRG